MPTGTYVKKPDTIEAIQYDGANHEEILAFCPSCSWDGTKLWMVTYTGGPPMEVPVEAWIYYDARSNWFTLFTGDFLEYWKLYSGDITQL